MKETKRLEAKLDDLEFAVFNEEAEEVITGPEEIGEYLAGLPTEKAITVLAGGMEMFCEELKNLVRQDLEDCYKSHGD